MIFRNIIVTTVIILLLLSVLFSGCTGEKKTNVTQSDSAQSDLSKLKIYPGDGNYLSSDTKILLHYSLNYTTLKNEDICLPYSANPGDFGIVIRGTFKNEYDRDYWIILDAAPMIPMRTYLGAA